jgi:hypothetical protein
VSYGGGDGNRTHVRSEAWEALDKTLKAIDLAALSFPSDDLNWKLGGTETPDESYDLGSGLRRLANHILSFEAEMSRRGQMCVIRINDAETRLGRRRQVNGIRHKAPPDHSEGGIVIKFCPWCGKNLEQQYASVKSLTSHARE